MKILFTINYGEEKFQMVRNLGYEVTYYDEKTIVNNEDINTADILVTYNPFSTLDISQMKNLKYIQTSSVGIDQIPKEEAINRNITVANNKGGYSIPMSEWIVMSILEIYKNSVKLHNQQKNKMWKMNMDTTELSDRIIGFIGTGTIATEAAKRLKPFGVEIWGVNTKGYAKEHFDRCFSTQEMNEVFKHCDAVICTIPATEDTIGLINKDKFDLMKHGTIFMNVGRGNIVKEKDLIECIDKFRGVAIDVFEEEPLSSNSPLWEFENVIVTPHNSWVSDKNKERTFKMIYNNLKKYIANEPLKNIIDINKGY